ncbi:HAMP domain-containing sensor histidine kinase [Collimonas sp.]|jgi:two-component system CAI-1 autoinducer sensor kinase/phosphatase CqsS|uniref:sensor histidine kinase n=1 Tax=Collimonas sp. TaxID=1963772 RepID=UPI002C4E9781|nr:HAMP domain-containing sensor histidine kinase [Collimonas sp.]HWW99299.1 HAMP domain-containing sensor histidine kinase [Collimonas sp.]
MIENISSWKSKRWRAWERAAGRWWLSINTQFNDMANRVAVLAWVAVIGMPLYYVIWAYWFPQPYENLALRMFCVALCAPIIFIRHLRQRKWLAVYFFVCMTYGLPFFFTFMFLMNDGSAVWGQSLLIGLVLLFHFDTTLAFLSYFVGSLLAYAAYATLHGSIMPLSVQILEQLPIQLFAIFTVSLAKVGRKVLAQEKLAGMATALATVSHELRTPLRSINANARGLSRLLQENAVPLAGNGVPIEKALARIEFEVRHMNNVIDLFLLSASTGKENLIPKDIVSMAAAVDLMMQRYPFVNQEQRDLVAITVRSDFRLLGQSELCSMVLINLLRNALTSIQRVGKGRIRIVLDGARSKPRLLFIDTGSGIEAGRMAQIFERFYAYPEHNGTGIGLAFCRDVLSAWGARIRVISRPLAYTIFVLEFPPVVQQKAADVRSLLN